MIKIAPSILDADFVLLKEQLQLAADGGADWIHVDIMDGHFVPSMTFGPKIVELIDQLISLPLDVHLMVEEPDNLIPSFIKAGADRITVHVEATKHLNRSINLIKRNGATAGVSLNPGTSASSLEAIIDEVDLILVMTVNPGFGGQSFIPSVLPKIRQISESVKSHQKDIFIEVDGGINKTTVPLVVEAGANVLVAGTSIFQTDDIKLAIREIRESLNRSLIVEEVSPDSE